MRKVYPICVSQCVEWRRLTARGGEPTDRPCFDYNVGRGPGPCVGAISGDQYAERVKQVASFLSGKHSGVAAELEERMREAARKFEFEKAAQLRDKVKALRERGVAGVAAG